MAALGNALLAVLGLIRELLDAYKAYRNRDRVDAVRDDPGSEWLRKFGGEDKRDGASTPTDDAGGGNHE